MEDLDLFQQEQLNKDEDIMILEQNYYKNAYKDKKQSKFDKILDAVKDLGNKNDVMKLSADEVECQLLEWINSMDYVYSDIFSAHKEMIRSVTIPVCEDDDPRKTELLRVFQMSSDSQTRFNRMFVFCKKYKQTLDAKRNQEEQEKKEESSPPQDLRSTEIHKFILNLDESTLNEEIKDDLILAFFDPRVKTQCYNFYRFLIQKKEYKFEELCERL